MSAGIKTVGENSLRRRITPAAAILLALGLGLAVLAPHAAAEIARPVRLSGSPGSASPVAYVVDQASDRVIPVDTATNTAGPSIPTGREPGSIAITPDGKTAYVVNISAATVTWIDTATNTTGPPIPVGSGPVALAITPDGKTVYVVNNVSGTVTPIQTATNTAGQAIPVGSFPVAIAITPDGKTVYVANLYSNTVTPIDTATNTAGPPIPVGNHPVAIAVTPDGKTAYVVNSNSGTNYAPGSVTPIDTATDTAGPAIPAGVGPFAIAITPDSQAAYVTNVYSDTVTPIVTATNTAGPPIPVGSGPRFIAITPDGKTAYVTDFDSRSVSAIATATNTAVSISVGVEPYAIALTSDGKAAYVANVSGTVTPIQTATDTAGPAVPVGGDPVALAITPATGSHPPAFTSAARDTVKYKVAFTFAVTTTGYPAPWIARRGRLPTGVRFTNNRNGTATISGTPCKCAAGIYRLTLVAKNKAGTATQAFTLAVTRPPVLRKLHTLRARAGRPVRRVIHANGYPPPALTEAGALPNGLSFSDHGNGTAILAGTPTAHSTGHYRITITAANASGTITRHLTIIISHRHHWSRPSRYSKEAPTGPVKASRPGQLRPDTDAPHVSMLDILRAPTFLHKNAPKVT